MQTHRFLNKYKPVALFVLLVIILLILKWRFADTSAQFFDSLHKANLPLLMGALLITMFHYLLEPLRWKIYFKSDNNCPSSYTTFLKVYGITALSSYILPAKMGFPTRIFLLNKQLKIPALSSTPILILDGLTNYALWGIGALILFPSDISLPINNISSQYFIFTPIALTFLIILATKLAKTIRTSTKTLYEKQILNLTPILTIITSDIVSIILRHMLIFHALGIFFDFKKTATVTVLSMFCGFISMLPLGLGAYDSIIIILLTSYGVSIETAILTPILNRLLNVACCFLIGLPSSYLLGSSLFSINNEMQLQKDAKVSTE